MKSFEEVLEKLSPTEIGGTLTPEEQEKYLAMTMEKIEHPKKKPTPLVFRAAALVAACVVLVLTVSMPWLMENSGVFHKYNESEAELFLSSDGNASVQAAPDTAERTPTEAVVTEEKAVITEEEPVPELYAADTAEDAPTPAATTQASESDSTPQTSSNASFQDDSVNDYADAAETQEAGQREQKTEMFMAAATEDEAAAFLPDAAAPIVEAENSKEEQAQEETPETPLQDFAYAGGGGGSGGGSSSTAKKVQETVTDNARYLCTRSGSGKKAVYTTIEKATGRVLSLQDFFSEEASYSEALAENGLSGKEQFYITEDNSLYVITEGGTVALGKIENGILK